MCALKPSLSETILQRLIVYLPCLGLALHAIASEIRIEYVCHYFIIFIFYKRAFLLKRGGLSYKRAFSELPPWWWNWTSSHQSHDLLQTASYYPRFWLLWVLPDWMLLGRSMVSTWWWNIPTWQNPGPSFIGITISENKMLFLLPLSLLNLSTLIYTKAKQN